MTKWDMIAIGEAMAQRNGSVNPLNYPDEIFDLYSVPAFDFREPEVLTGSEIGSTKQIVEPNDVLLSKIVPHIRRAWVVGPRSQHRLIASNEWMVFRSKLFDPKYLSHYLVYDNFHVQLMKTVSGVGGSLLRARPAQVAKIEIPLPPLPEQRRLAAVLDAADAIRKARTESLRRLDELVKATFLDMFGDPVTNPKGWERVSLSKFADVLTGYPFNSAQYTNDTNQVKICGGLIVMPDRIEWENAKYWPANQCSKLEQYWLAEGDIVLAMDRPWISTGIKVAIIKKSELPCLLIQRTARVRCDGIPNEYVIQLFRSSLFTRHCKPTETTVPHIAIGDIKNFVVPLPTLPLLQQFSKFAQEVERQRESIQTALIESENLFASLSQRAFRGEL